MEILETHRVAIADLLKKDLAPDVITMLNDALNEGYSFADVVSMLDEQGYKVMIHPVDEGMDKAAPKKGDFVSWNSSGGTARGKIERIITEGSLDIPDSSFSIAGSSEEPAALIRIWSKKADGWEKTETVVGHKVSTLSVIADLAKAAQSPSTFDAPEGVQAAAKRAQGWIADGYAGDGFTDVGRARMSQLAGKGTVSLSVLKKMFSYFARHGVNRTKSFDLVEGKPTPWRVAWDAWGGDAGKSWTDSIYKRYDLAKSEHDDLDEFDKGFGPHAFKEAKDSASCTECKQASDNWRHKVSKEVGYNLISKSIEEKRFTLAPMYVPNTLDAQGEWTDPEELQGAVWEYVKRGDRGIRLQHNRDINAGEWVECMQIPYPMTVPMYKADGVVSELTYPAGTVFLGVIWEPWAWDLVKQGKLSGYSIGGRTERILADLPQAESPATEQAAIEANQASLKAAGLTAQSIAEAIAIAMKQIQPVVNVVMPETRTSRRVERDEHGNIVRIVEE